MQDQSSGGMLESWSLPSTSKLLITPTMSTAVFDTQCSYYMSCCRSSNVNFDTFDHTPGPAEAYKDQRQTVQEWLPCLQVCNPLRYKQPASADIAAERVASSAMRQDRSVLHVEKPGRQCRGYTRVTMGLLCAVEQAQDGCRTRHLTRLCLEVLLHGQYESCGGRSPHRGCR